MIASNINTSGLVGIGTDNPLQRFQIGTANTLGINSEGTIFVVTSNADVGIGTTNPTSKLHVVGNTNIIGTLELGHETDTTLARVSAGVVSIEGVNIVTTSSTDTLTNKTLTSPTLTTPSLGAATATSIVVGSGVTINASGIIASAGIITATTFVGALTGTASNVTTNANLTGDVTSSGNATAIAAGVIVDADINASAGIVDTKLATISTALKVSNSATTATDANTASAIVARDASGNFSAGIITATQLSTGASGTGVNITTNTISGPSILTIDPAAVGDDTGAVRIKGDLYVDGTQFIVNSTTIELADFRIGIGTTATSDDLLNGAGIGIGSASNQKL